MRLIDADKVKQYALTEGFYCDTEADKEATAEMIDQLFPTVEAIPMEWIKKWCGQFIDDRGRYHGEGYDSIWDLLEDWEKEHD